MRALWRELWPFNNHGPPSSASCALLLSDAESPGQGRGEGDRLVPIPSWQVVQRLWAGQGTGTSSGTSCGTSSRTSSITSSGWWEKQLWRSSDRDYTGTRQTGWTGCDVCGKVSRYAVAAPSPAQLEEESSARQPEGDCGSQLHRPIPSNMMMRQRTATIRLHVISSR